MSRTMLLAGFIWAASAAAFAAEPPSIYDRWLTLDSDARLEYPKVYTPPRLFADEREYKAFLDEASSATRNRRAEVSRSLRQLLLEAEHQTEGLRFEDHVALANIAASINDFEAARHYLESAVQTSGDDPRVLLVTAYIAASKDDLDVAERTVSRIKAGAKLPDTGSVRFVLALLNNHFARARRTDAHLKTVEITLELNRSGHLEMPSLCETSLITVDLALQKAGRDGWGERAIEVAQRERERWDAMSHSHRAWISGRLQAREMVLLSEMGKQDEANARVEAALAETRARRQESPDDEIACLRWIAFEGARLQLLPPAKRLSSAEPFIESLHATIRQFPTEAMALEYGRRVYLYLFDLIRAEKQKQALALKQSVLRTLRGLPPEFQTSPALFRYAYRAAFMPDSEIERGLRRNELVGKPAPPLEVGAWLNGPAVTADDLRGKVVLVDFWAVWCGPCVQAFPMLVGLHRKYVDKGLVIVGITQRYRFGWDAEKSRPEKMPDISDADEQAALEAFARHHELPYRLAFDAEGNKLFERFGVEGIPQLVLIDRKGVVRMVEVGYDQSSDEKISKQIEALLAE